MGRVPKPSGKSGDAGGVNCKEGMPRFEKSVFDMKYAEKLAVGGKERSISPSKKEDSRQENTKLTSEHQIKDYPEWFQPAH